VTWADWVGDWSGALTWKGCAVDGNKSATLPVDAIDGVMHVDLAPAGNRLESVTLVGEEDGSWSAQTADMTLALKLDKGKLAIRAELSTGCTLTAALAKKAQTCPQLVAWARIESKCTKLTSAPIEAKLEAKPTGCDARSKKVERELIDAGCAPNPEPDIALRAKSCRALVLDASKLDRCGGLPADARARIMSLTQQLAAAAQTATKAELPAIESQCEDVHAQLRELAAQTRCSL